MLSTVAKGLNQSVPARLHQDKNGVDHGYAWILCEQALDSDDQSEHKRW